MMYIPPAFRQDNWELATEIIRKYSFADIIGTAKGDITISKNPIILNKEGEINFHLANGNPIIDAIKENGKLSIIVSGPHEYISPAWYKVKPAVPTWNYIVIQLNCYCDIIQNKDWMISHHKDLVNAHEKFGWDSALSDDFGDKLNGMIVGVNARIINYEAKFKLGQNRSDADFTGIYSELIKNNPENELAKIMKKYTLKKY